MAYTCKLIRALPNDIESQVKAYLDGQSPTTIHSLVAFHSGRLIAVLIVFE